MHSNPKKQLFKSIVAGFLLGAVYIGSSAFNSWSPMNEKEGAAGSILAREVSNDSIPEKPTDVSPLLIGENIPSLQLPDATGRSFDLNKAVAESPTIIVFYRGGWCPYCTRQLAGIQEIEKDLKKLGYKIIALSTDSPENLAKTSGTEKLSYTLLSDSETIAAKAFGIAFKGPKVYDKLLPEASGGKNVDKLLPVPSIFLVDTKGIIQFEYINPNYKERISPALLKAAATVLADDLKAIKQ